MKPLLSRVWRHGRAFCLRVSGAVAPSAPGPRPGLSRACLTQDVDKSSRAKMERQVAADQDPIKSALLLQQRRILSTIASGTLEQTVSQSVVIVRGAAREEGFHDQQNTRSAFRGDRVGGSDG